MVMVDENAPPSNVSVMMSPSKVPLGDESTPTPKMSPRKLRIVDENMPPPNVSVRSAQGKVATVDEGVAPPNMMVTSSPDKFVIAEDTVQAQETPSLQEEVFALCERGQKRTASTAMLSEAGGIDKVRATAEEEPAKEDTNVEVVSPDIELQLESPENDPMQEAAKEETNVDVVSPDIVLQLESPENDPMQEAAKEGTNVDVVPLETVLKVPGNDPMQAIDELVATSKSDNGDDAPERELSVSLECYKTIIDFKTELQASPDDEHATTCSNEVGIAEVQRSLEWQDPATGTIMGYVAASEWSDNETTMLENEETATPLQITVAWHEPATGAMLGYAFCDDDDQELQAMQLLLDGQGDTNAPDVSATTRMGSDELGEEDPAALDDVVTEEGSKEVNSPATSQMGEDGTFQAMDSEWKDSTSGVVMAYACDEDSEFGDHLEMKLDEWEDPETGAVLGYGVCAEASEDEVSNFVTCGDESLDDSETAADDGIVMGYGYDEGSEVDECQTKELYRKAKKSRGGVAKRRCQPLMLRLRKQHVRRVIKSKRLRK